jgi:methylamine---corrinoid protein Co-methyltransferase
MTTLPHLIEMLGRANTGPVMEQEEWDMQVINSKTKEVIAKHGLKKTCDKENPVNTDDGLADRFWEAGVDLAAQTGLHCISTERVIQFSEEEIADAIADQPSEVRYGLGKDHTIRRRRKPEENTVPTFTSIIGSPMSEELYVDTTAAIAAIPGVDAISGATMVTAYGEEVLGASPMESIAGYLEARLKREALEKAGRPGMSVTATENSPTAYGTLSSFAVPGGFKPDKDIVAILGIAELKIGFEHFFKAVHCVQCGGRLRGGQPAMVGGFAGGPEGAILTNIVMCILYRALFGTEYGGGNVLDVRYQGNCGPAGNWAQSILNQAISRNSNFLAEAVATQVSGPNTQMLLWESAVGVLTNTVSGASGNFAPYTSGGVPVDYMTPLETIFCTELGVAGSKMTRAQVNELAKVLIPRYEKDLFNPPHGQSIRQCYDITTMEPHEDWLALYENSKAELISMGVPL